jgi:anaerobic selenocysteine-containing dehydrogenase
MLRKKVAMIQSMKETAPLTEAEKTTVVEVEATVGKRQGFSRRDFVKGATAVGASVVGVSTASATLAALGKKTTNLALAEEEIAPATKELVRTTCGPNCTGACGVKALISDGQIKTIIQASDYADPSLSPRGCLKGLSMNTMLYGPDRLVRPLIRRGERANGNSYLEETDWDEALDFAARRINEITAAYGADAIGLIWQVPPLSYVNKGAAWRLSNMMGWSNFPGYDMNGDLPIFWGMTFGVQSEELYGYCWEDSRYTLIFGSNVMTTRLPDAHFLKRSQERGGTVVYFDPNYTVTAEKADEWVRIKPASDTAIALGMAKILVDENLYDKNFMRTYTDAPLLIRSDTGKRLLARDVMGLSLPEVPEYRQVYVALDQNTPISVDPRALDLPQSVMLEGTHRVTLTDGNTVEAKPSFALITEALEEWTSEKVEDVSGMKAADLLRITREMAKSRPLHIILGGSAFQWNHGDLKGRALSLVACLCGSVGQLGGGISTYVGQYRVAFKAAAWWIPENAKRASLPFAYFVNGRTKTMKAPYPAHGIKALLTGWGNPLDQHNVANVFKERLESGEIEFMLVCEFQRTTTVEYADVVLPGTSWYEKSDLITTPLHPYLQMTRKLVEPIGESRAEIWIFTELARRIDSSLAQYFPTVTPENTDEICKETIESLLEKGGVSVEGITLADLQAGPMRLRHDHPGSKRIPFYHQIVDKVPFPPQSLPEVLENTAQFVKSGRIEFYKDEDTFLAQREQVPVYKPPFEDTEYAINPESREKYPFIYLTRNSLYRIHSTYSNNPVILELQENKPLLWINPDDAARLGLAEGDHVEAYNDRGVVRGYLTLEPGLYPGQVVFEQGWWSRYTENTSYNSLIRPFINPVHETYYVGAIWSPNMAWNECLCNVRKVVQ